MLRILWPGGKWRWPLRLFIVMVPFTIISVEATSQSGFCKSCHIMESYYASWHRGAHKEVECVRCHIPPGAQNFVAAKLNGLGQVVDDVLERTATKPSASVSDFACTRPGCHDMERVRAQSRHDGKFFFNHAKHLDLEYKGVQVHCTTCHSHSRGEQHFEVDTNTCITCHLAYNGANKPLVASGSAAPQSASGGVASAKGALVKTVMDTTPAGAPAAATPAEGAGHEKHAPSDCLTCHNPPDHPIEYQGLTVVHSEYLAYGASCESCHRGATASTQKVKSDQCFTCHEFGIERFTSPEEMHKVHSDGKHKVECFSCHGITRHGPAAQAMRLDQIDCQSCHVGQHNIQQRTYKSTDPPHATASAAPAVTPMFLAHVACTGCHIQPRSVSVKPLSGATVNAATPAACDSCHKPGMGEKMIPMWQKATHETYDAIIKQVPAQMPTSPEAVKLINEARQLLDLVKLDGSWGVHNPRYTQALLEEAQKKLLAAKDVAGKGESL
ncbi:MAG TPA: NapC/NirT family cytochrome c [Tepidisphaeraceae bacterium]|jgi:nitrate/TMAO reductase-like tetraheme cytochrome c subunit